MLQLRNDLELKLRTWIWGHFRESTQYSCLIVSSLTVVLLFFAWSSLRSIIFFVTGSNFTIWNACIFPNNKTSRETNILCDTVAISIIMPLPAARQLLKYLIVSTSSYDIILLWPVFTFILFAIIITINKITLYIIGEIILNCISSTLLRLWKLDYELTVEEIPRKKFTEPFCLDWMHKLFGRRVGWLGISSSFAI